MNATVSVNPQVTTLINILTVAPENQSKLIESLRENADTVVRNLPGWISTSLLASRDKTRVVIYSQWADLDSLQAMQSDARMQAYFPQVAALASFDSTVADVVYSGQA